MQKKLSPRYFFLRSLNVSRQLVKAGRRQTPASGTGARPRARLGLGQGHGVQAPGEGARRVGLRLRAEAGLRGGAAACGAARSAAAGAQREVLRLSGVVHVVGGPDVLHGRVLAALLGPEERVLEDPARAARQAVGCAARNAHGQPRRCRRANSRRAGQRSSNLARGGRPFCQAPQVPEGSAHALGGNGHLSLLRSHGRRLLYCLRAALHLLRALPRLVQEALHVTGPADDLQRRLRRPGRGSTFRRTYSAAWKACAPMRSAGRRSVMEGGPCPLLASAKAGSAVPLLPPRKAHVRPWPLRECGSLPRELLAGTCAAEAVGWGPRWTGSGL